MDQYTNKIVIIITASAQLHYDFYQKQAPRQFDLEIKDSE